MKPNLIESDPAVMMGKPTIAGTRLTVEHLLEEMAAGTSVEQLLQAYPRLTAEAMSAALALASQFLSASPLAVVPRLK